MPAGVVNLRLKMANIFRGVQKSLNILTVPARQHLKTQTICSTKNLSSINTQEAAVPTEQHDQLRSSVKQVGSRFFVSRQCLIYEGIIVMNLLCS